MDAKALRTKYRILRRSLNERTRRLWAAAEAIALGRGGVDLVAEATGLGHATIWRGVREARGGEQLEPGRVRRLGGGRKRAVEKDPGIVKAIV